MDPIKSCVILGVLTFAPALALDGQKFFRYGSSNIPHFQKRHKGGEDAWLAQEDLMVIADGVGGWE
jgi:hypothetical protein